jgi:hypothetical protein
LLTLLPFVVKVNNYCPLARRFYLIFFWEHGREEGNFFGILPQLKPKEETIINYILFYIVAVQTALFSPEVFDN